MNSRIRFDSVNLHYPVVSYAQRSLVKLVGRWFTAPGNRPAPLRDIHALKSVTVDIRKGERVALLGHNGAGKSTFLKTVAGLFPISGGQVDVQGSVRSLFDISLGFEPDATGRANILYRGLLMGLSPRDVRSREHEIVEFADLGEAIDYPLATYSAGMQVRLAFAISTFVGGDILLLDEVIGAGDAKFMVRAKARIEELIRESEIMILASHDLGTVRGMCDRGLVLHHGELAFDGRIDHAVDCYRRINGLLHA